MCVIILAKNRVSFYLYLENLNVVEFKNNELTVWQRNLQGRRAQADVEKVDVIVREIHITEEKPHVVHLHRRKGVLKAKPSLRP